MRFWVTAIASFVRLSDWRATIAPTFVLTEFMATGFFPPNLRDTRRADRGRDNRFG